MRKTCPQARLHLRSAQRRPTRSSTCHGCTNNKHQNFHHKPELALEARLSCWPMRPTCRTWQAETDDEKSTKGTCQQRVQSIEFWVTAAKHTTINRISKSSPASIKSLHGKHAVETWKLTIIDKSFLKRITFSTCNFAVRAQARLPLRDATLGTMLRLRFGSSYYCYHEYYFLYDYLRGGLLGL